MNPLCVKQTLSFRLLILLRTIARAHIIMLIYYITTGNIFPRLLITFQMFMRLQKLNVNKNMNRTQHLLTGNKVALYFTEMNTNIR